MKLQALTIFLLAFVASTYATISPEVYWKVKLPNTQIPKVIKDFLPQSELKQDNTKEKVYYGLSGYIAISWHHPADSAYERLVLKKVQEKENPIKQVTEEKLDDGPLNQYFILEKDLEKGNVINFPSLLNKNEAPFLSRRFAESIPFSMEKFSEILNHFSINSKSKDAQEIEKTIKLCEEPEVKHKEMKTCATSLESMVDFGISVLGTNDILAITSEVQGKLKNRNDTQLNKLNK
ncbi:BURP domain protein RD22-like [Lycium barbarum]|uniref:BURP domain protein RD22-like n=1 Tax=Lycium barbarum TaxID=112863 RepID=UPI00293F1740|nr:BURP domain protein RD22-like [Lycium barbarum]